MPVWYDAARELAAQGRLRIIGITEEQHADRCRLYAQWKGYDFPILWDPFNLTGSSAVPLVMGIDAAGVLRLPRMDVRRAREELETLLGTSWPAEHLPRLDPFPAVGLEVTRDEGGAANPRVAADRALGRLLFSRVRNAAPPSRELFGSALSALEVYAAAEGAPASARFRLGVARRLRYDSPWRDPADFQASLDDWYAALEREPARYIWRRRIQQWGPRLDKPYPFYDWVESALVEVRARGEEPVVPSVPLTGAEVAGGTREIPRREAQEVHPDPKGGLPRDTEGLVHLETAVALHTGPTAGRVRVPPGTARIHLVLRPDREHSVHWGNEAGPTRLWIEVPAGWDVRHNLWTFPLTSKAPTSSEVRRLDFEVRPPLGPPSGHRLHGTLFYPVCLGDDGVCTLLAQDFEIEVPLPASPSGAGPADEAAGKEGAGDDSSGG